MLLLLLGEEKDQLVTRKLLEVNVRWKRSHELVKVSLRWGLLELLLLLL